MTDIAGTCAGCGTPTDTGLILLGSPELIACRLAMLDPGRDLGAAIALLVGHFREASGDRWAEWLDEPMKLDVWACRDCASRAGVQTALRLPGAALPAYA
jgi:hypothetical protein